MNYRAAGEDSGGTAASWRAADSLSMFEPFQEDRTSTLLTRFVSVPHPPENESEASENASDYTHAGPASRRPRSAGKRGSQRAADEKNTDEQTVQPSARGGIHQVNRTSSQGLVSDDACVKRGRTRDEDCNRQNRMGARREASPARACYTDSHKRREHRQVTGKQRHATPPAVARAAGERRHDHTRRAGEREQCD